MDKFKSIGPWPTYEKIEVALCHSPNLWRKVARMMSKLRRIDRVDFKGESRRRARVYAHSAFRDTRLPLYVKEMLQTAIIEEFNFDPNQY